MNTEKKVSWLQEQTVETGSINGYKYFILMAPPYGKDGAMNGYVVFPKKPLRQDGYDGLAAYVPVHGGITYAKEVAGEGFVYGFDTLHYQSELSPVDDKEWIKGQCKIMVNAILVASKVEAKYMKCLTDSGKYKYCQMVRNAAEKPENAPINMSETLRLMSGKL